MTVQDRQKLCTALSAFILQSLYNTIDIYGPSFFIIFSYIGIFIKIDLHILWPFISNTSSSFSLSLYCANQILYLEELHQIHHRH